MKFFGLLTVACLASSCFCRPSYNSDPFRKSLATRQSAVNSSGNGSLQVDLGYAVYEGYTNSTSGLNIWKGMRYAASPTGSYRFQAPQAPPQNRSSTIQANELAPTCYQNPDASTSIMEVNQTLASEDCLFLNIYAPGNITSPLPVLVWIHGGGYGAGNGRQDLSDLINTNNGTFIGVSIQYRLGAFGFLSSDEVYRSGTPNAGLYDQYFALQWVQSHISLFGGNASHVTISGVSAGGGSVMLLDMAYGGTIGDSLFTNTIAASPYLPMQYGYSSWIPSQAYYAFATAAGCPPGLPYGSVPQTIFECLVEKDAETLQNASGTISQSGNYGTWAFLPVTDGALVQDTPSRQLLARKVNGRNALVGNNANEGAPFTPQNITTEDELVLWLQLTFPLFSNADISKVLLYYPSSNDSTNSMDPSFATSGYTGATALNVSSVGTGQQQRADNIYAETTFVCPSYWLAEAYSSLPSGTSYKYQYSVPPALHGTDQIGYFGPAQLNVGPDMVTAFQTIWGNFITTNNPSIPASIANGANLNESVQGNAIEEWPRFEVYAPYQIDLNQTGGTEVEVPFGMTRNITVMGGPTARNNITLVNAYTWEGGRGYRCDFWRSVGLIVPE